MLFLLRKIGQAIMINNQVRLTVIEIRGKTVKLGFEFPPEASVLREEIYEKIKSENLAASQTDASVLFEVPLDLEDAIRENIAS